MVIDTTLDADGDGSPDVDASSTPTDLEQAITTWAVDKMGPERSFTLYLMDHGDYDRFYLDGSAHEVTPDELDGWLDALESAAPGVTVNVIVEACHSGSFIDLLQSVSQPGRLVIASAGAWGRAYASDTGAVFSDHFLSALGRGMSLYASFQEAEWAACTVHPDQTPWLDDDGDGFPNEAEDGGEASGRGFAFAGTVTEVQWPPYVASAGVSESGAITAEVRDDGSLSQVWAAVYPPSYTPPSPGAEMVQDDLPTVTLAHQSGDLYTADYDFAEAGPYRVVVYAVDDEGIIGRPQSLGEQHRGYLPLILRAYTPPVSFPIHIGEAIPSRSVVHRGEVFYTTSLRMPDTLPEGGRFYLSSRSDAVEEVMVDDEVAILVEGSEVFSHIFSSEGIAPEPALVEVERAVMEALVGQTATVEYRDVYGIVVGASEMWLVWSSGTR